MKKLLAAASAAAFMVGAAIPAHAATFATIAGASVNWSHSGTGPFTGTLSSSGTNTFTFGPAQNLVNLLGTLVFDVSENGGSFQTGPFGSLTLFDQEGLSGSFQEIYQGPDNAVVDGITLHTGSTVLLSGDLSNGALLASDSHGSANGGELDFTANNYASPFFNMLGSPESLDITIALAGQGLWSSYTHNGHSVLGNFSGATASGNFLAANVTEPGAWMLMLGGVGFTGAMLRRRRLAGLPA